MDKTNGSSASCASNQINEINIHPFIFLSSSLLWTNLKDSLDKKESIKSQPQIIIQFTLLFGSTFCQKIWPTMDEIASRGK